MEYIFFFEVWRSEKRIVLSEKKPPLILLIITCLAAWIKSRIAQNIKKNSPITNDGKT